MRITSDRLISVHPVSQDDREDITTVLKVLKQWTASPYMGLGDIVDPSCTFSALVKSDCVISSVNSLESTRGVHNPQLASSRLARSLASERPQADGATTELSLFDAYLVGPYGMLTREQLATFERRLARNDQPELCIHLALSGPIHTSLAGLCAWLLSQVLLSPSRTFSRKFPKAVGHAHPSASGTYAQIGIHALLPTTHGLEVRAQSVSLAPNLCVTQTLLPHVGLALPEVQPYMHPIANPITSGDHDQDETGITTVSIAKNAVSNSVQPALRSAGTPLKRAGFVVKDAWAKSLTAVLSRIYRTPALVELALSIARTQPRLTSVLRKVVKSGETQSHNPYLRASEISYLSEAFDVEEVK